MNTLSWYLYAADVVGNMGALLVMAALIGLVVTVMLAAFSAGHYSDARDLWHSDGQKAHCGEAARRLLKGAVLAGTVTVILSVCAAVLPSTTTIHQIAASEIGEMTVASEYGQEILGDLKDVLSAQLDALKGGAE